MPENITNGNAYRSNTLFHTNGKPYKAGTVEINYKKKIYSITITPISGRVLFKEGIYSKFQVENFLGNVVILLIEVFVAISISLVVMSTVSIMLSESMNLIKQTDSTDKFESSLMKMATTIKKRA